jgi:hypothetical protein
MKMWMVATAGTIALALAGCSKGDSANNQQAGNGSNTAQASGLPTPPQRPGPNGAANLQIDEQGVANACLPAEDQRRPIESFPVEQRRTIVSCLIGAAARSVSGQLPMRVNADLTLERVTAEGLTLTYFVTVAKRAAELPPNIGQQLETGARQSLCMRPETRQLIDLGGSYAYRWTDRNGVLIHEMQINTC